MPLDSQVKALLEQLAATSAAFLKGGKKRADADGAAFWAVVPRSTAWLAG